MSNSEAPAEGANPEGSEGDDPVESSVAVSMRQLRREGLRSFLDAEINDDGDLVLQGQDLGEFVSRRWEPTSTSRRRRMRSRCSLRFLRLWVSLPVRTSWK